MTHPYKSKADSTHKAKASRLYADGGAVDGAKPDWMPKDQSRYGDDYTKGVNQLGFGAARPADSSPPNWARGQSRGKS